MFLAKVSIERPVLATMLNLVLVVFGFFCIAQIGHRPIPECGFSNHIRQCYLSGSGSRIH